MDISMPGAWGEGSHTDLFTREQLKNFIDIYTDSFKNTLLIGQTCIPWLVEQSNEKASVGWRADCIGKPELTYVMLPPKVEKMGEIWKKGHVSFESYWWLSEWKRQGWDIDKIFETLLSWHVSTFNAKSLPIPWEWKEKVDAFTAKASYHFVIEEIDYPETVKRGETYKFSLIINNVGVAPVYRRLPLYFRLKKENLTQVFKTDTDIREWIQGEYKETVTLKIPASLSKGKYKLQIGIGGNGEPSVVFATDTDLDGNYSVLTDVYIV